MNDRAASLLLLPGLLCDDRIWSVQASLLADAGPIAVSSYGDATTLEEMAAAALAQAPGMISLAGHSMGARVALEIYRMAPDRVAHIALISTGVHPVGPGEADKRRALLRLGEEQGSDALIDAWLPPMLNERHRADQAVIEPLRRMCRDGGVDLYRRQIEAMLVRPEVETLLPQIDCPALIAVGRDDAWSPVSQHEAMAAAMPDAQMVVFEDCGHMSPVEAPEALAAALRDWLDRPAAAR